MSVRSRSRWLGVLALSLVPFISISISCSGKAADSGEASASGTAEATDGTADADSNMAPEFTLNDIDGNSLSLAETTG